jgi:hypothetical protein
MYILRSLVLLYPSKGPYEFDSEVYGPQLMASMAISSSKTLEHVKSASHSAVGIETIGQFHNTIFELLFPLLCGTICVCSLWSPVLSDFLLKHLCRRFICKLNRLNVLTVKYLQALPFKAFAYQIYM